MTEPANTWVPLEREEVKVDISPARRRLSEDDLSEDDLSEDDVHAPSSESASPATPPSAGSEETGQEPIPSVPLDVGEAPTSRRMSLTTAPSEDLKNIRHYTPGRTVEELGLKIPPDSPLRHDLEPEFVVPFTLVERATLTEILTGSKDRLLNKQGVDMPRLIYQIAVKRLDKWKQVYMRDNNASPGEKDSDKKFNSLIAELDEEMTALIMAQRGVKSSVIPGSHGVAQPLFFVDYDKDRTMLSGPVRRAHMRTQRQLDPAAGPLGIADYYQNPELLVPKEFDVFSAMWQPMNINYIEPPKGETGPGKLSTYNDRHVLGWLDRLGRIGVQGPMAVAEYLARDPHIREKYGLGERDTLQEGMKHFAWPTGATQEGVIGTPEHILMLQHGKEIFTPEIADELGLGNIGWLLRGAGLSPREGSAYNQAHRLLSANMTDEEYYDATYREWDNLVGAMVFSLFDIDGFSAITGGAKLLKQAGGPVGALRNTVFDYTKTSTRAKFLTKQKTATSAAENIAAAAKSKADVPIKEMEKIVREELDRLPADMRGSTTLVAHLTNSIFPGRSRVTEEVGEAFMNLAETHIRGEVTVNPWKTVSPGATVGKEAVLGEKALSKIGKVVAQAGDTEIRSAKAAVKAAVERGRSDVAYSIANVAKEYRRAQVAHMYSAMVMADLITIKRTLASVARLTRMSSTGAKKGPDITRAIEEQIRIVQETRNDMAAAYMETRAPKSDPTGHGPVTKKYSEAVQKHEQAMSYWSRLVQAYAVEAGKEADSLLEVQIQSANRLFKEVGESLDAKRALIQKNKLFIVDAKSHNDKIKAVVQMAPAQMASRALATTVAVALKEVASQYGELARFAKTHRGIGGTKVASREYVGVFGKTLDEALSHNPRATVGDASRAGYSLGFPATWNSPRRDRFSSLLTDSIKTHDGDAYKIMEDLTEDPTTLPPEDIFMWYRIKDYLRPDLKIRARPQEDMKFTRPSGTTGYAWGISYRNRPLIELQETVGVDHAGMNPATLLHELWHEATVNRLTVAAGVADAYGISTLEPEVLLKDVGGAIKHMVVRKEPYFQSVETVYGGYRDAVSYLGRALVGRADVLKDIIYAPLDKEVLATLKEVVATDKRIAELEEATDNWNRGLTALQRTHDPNIMENLVSPKVAEELKALGKRAAEQDTSLGFSSIYGASPAFEGSWMRSFGWGRGEPVRHVLETAETNYRKLKHADAIKDLEAREALLKNILEGDWDRAKTAAEGLDSIKAQPGAFPRDGSSLGYGFNIDPRRWVDVVRSIQSVIGPTLVEGTMDPEVLKKMIERQGHQWAMKHVREPRKLPGGTITGHRGMPYLEAHWKAMEAAVNDSLTSILRTHATLSSYSPQGYEDLKVLSALLQGEDTRRLGSLHAPVQRKIPGGTNTDFMIASLTHVQDDLVQDIIEELPELATYTGPSRDLLEEASKNSLKLRVVSDIIVKLKRNRARFLMGAPRVKGYTAPPGEGLGARHHPYRPLSDKQQSASELRLLAFHKEMQGIWSGLMDAAGGDPAAKLAHDATGPEIDSARRSGLYRGFLSGELGLTDDEAHAVASLLATSWTSESGKVAELITYAWEFSDVTSALRKLPYRGPGEEEAFTELGKEGERLWDARVEDYGGEGFRGYSQKSMWSELVQNVADLFGLYDKGTRRLGSPTSGAGALIQSMGVPSDFMPRGIVSDATSELSLPPTEIASMLERVMLLSDDILDVPLEHIKKLDMEFGSGTRQSEGFPSAPELPGPATPTRPGPSEAAKDVYIARQIEETSEWESRLSKNERRLIPHMLMKWREAGRHIFGPDRFHTKKQLGIMNEEQSQIGISSLAQMSDIRDDIVKISPSHLEKRNAVEVVQRFIDYNDTLQPVTRPSKLGMGEQFTFMNTAWGGRTQWQAALPLLRHNALSFLATEADIRALAKGELGKAVREDPTDTAAIAIKILAKSWLPPDLPRDVSEGELARLYRGTSNILIYGDAKTPAQGAKKAAAEALQKDINSNGILYKDFMEKMWRLTEGIFGTVDGDRTRVHSHATRAVGQMAIMDSSATRFMKTISTIPEETIAAAVRISSGAVSLDPEADITAAFAMLNHLQMPAKIRQLGARTEETIRLGLKKVMETPEGERIFVPRAFMDTTSNSIKLLEKAVNELKTPTMSYLYNKAIDVVTGALRLFYSAILYGLGIARAAYYTTIKHGNLGQIWSTQGPYQAARAGVSSAGDVVWESQHLATHIPGLGKYVDGMLERAGANAASSGEHPLGSILNTILNVHGHMILDARHAPDTLVVTGATGRKETLGVLREWVREEQVKSTFSRKSGLSRLNSRIEHSDGKIEKILRTIFAGITGPKDTFAEFFNTIEQQQRVNLFTDLVMNQNMPKEEAGKIMREALMDWDTPMSKFEAVFLSKAFMFWGFTKKAYAQAAMVLLDPFISTKANDTIIDVLIKSSPGLSFLAGKKAYKTTQLKTLVQGESKLRDYYERDKETSPIAPWWAHTTTQREYSAGTPLSEEGAANMSTSSGYPIDTKVFSTPSHTVPAMAESILDIVAMFAGYAASWAEYPLHVIKGETPRPSQTGFSDVLATLANNMIHSASPLLQPSMEHLRQTSGLGDKSVQISGGVRPINNSQVDAGILRLFGTLLGDRNGLAWENPKDKGTDKEGRVYAKQSTLFIYYLIPALSRDLNTNIEPFLDAHREGLPFNEALAQGLLHVMGFKTTYYSGAAVADRHTKDVKKHARALDTAEDATPLPQGRGVTMDMLVRWITDWFNSPRKSMVEDTEDAKDAKDTEGKGEETPTQKRMRRYNDAQ